MENGKFRAWRGYTLVEILIGLTILSLMFVGGYTAYREFVRRQLLNNTAGEIKLNLNLARQKSLASERPSAGECNNKFLGYTVTFAATAYTISPDCDVTDPGILSPYVKTYTLPGFVTLTVSGTAVPNRILFKVLGGGADVAASGAVITLRHTEVGNVKTLTVSTSGVIK